MSIKSIITIVVLYLCFECSHQHLHKVFNLEIPDRSSTNGKDWDFVIFTQSWPASVCKMWTEHKPNHHCVYPKSSDSWTIHGIWPTKTGTKGPFNCNTTWLFDPEEVKPIEDELEQAWTNIEKETSLYRLWAHEWNKHGTCAAMIEPFNSQIKYFSRGIDFHNKYSMANILSSSSIVPSDTKLYNAVDINTAIVSKLGKRAFISCTYEDGVQYLVDLRICFDKELNLIECADMHEDNGLLTSCNIAKGIVYPTEAPPPKRYLVQLHKFVNWLQWFTL